MSSKFSVVLVALVGFLALASAVNPNGDDADGVGPITVEPGLLAFLLSQQISEPTVEPTKTDVSLWERAVLSPFSRMASYLRQFGCSAVAPPSVTCTCGIKGNSTNTSRILGGQESTLKKWPWMAYLLMDNTTSCGGSVISENWVISAARCFKSVKRVDVYLGINDIRVIALHVTTANFTIHPRFDSYTFDNDIALLRLIKPAPLSAAIQPICLPYKFATTNIAGQNATVTGWGATSEGGTSSNKLLEMSVPILNRTQCSTSPFLYSINQITDNMFCMYRQAAVDSCQGDTGGPVNWQNGTKTYLVGIVSWGTGCGRATYPGVYTKVTNYLSWIDQTTGQTFCNI